MWERITAIFEEALWFSRMLIIIPVLGSILLACGAVFLGTVEEVKILEEVAGLASAGADATHPANLENTLVAGAIKALDIYLLAAILLIFGLGLYELFISKIDPAEKSPGASRVLLIRDLDDLKERLGKVVLLVLVIEFLQQALRMSYTSVLDLLFLGGGILAVGIALYLTTRKERDSSSER